MSVSAKPTANRRAISRWGVVITALAVLAAGCSQSEDGASDGSEPATSSFPAGLSSAAPPVAESTTTTQASVEEEPPSSGSEAATTTTSLPPAEAEVALSDEAIRLIDVGVDACGDLLQFRCAGAVMDICFQLRSDSALEQSVRRSGDGIILSEDEQSDICGMYESVRSWEVDAVLSAKYGEEYYRWNPGFLAFRDEFSFMGSSFLLSRPELFPREKYYEEHLTNDHSSIEDIGSFDEFVDDSSWGEYLPDAVKLKLLRIFYDFGLALQSGHNNLQPKSEDVARRILSVPDFPEAHRQCYGIEVSLAEMLTSEPTRGAPWDLEVFVCIDNLCANREAGNAVVCYFEGDDIDEFSNGRAILRDRSATVSDFLWNAIKYFCAKDAEDDNAFPNDACHRVATNTCRIASTSVANTEYSNLRISSRLERLVCGLGSAWHYQTYNNARAKCYREIENLLTTMDLLLAQDSSCNDASEECAEFWRGRDYVAIYYPIIYYPEKSCLLFRQYYTFEVFWRKMPFICTQNNNLSSIFMDSECYDFIRGFCDSRYGTANYERFRSYDLLIYYESPIRGGKKIREVLCGRILDTRTQTSVKNNLGHRYLTLTLNESQKNLIADIDPESPGVRTIREKMTLQLTYDNLDKISSAVKECANNSFATSEPRCIIALWKSCFDLFSYKLSSRIPHFHGYYEVDAQQEFWNSITYVCTAAWITELARMASVLSSSFPEDYQAGSFNRFMEYVTVQAVGDTFVEGILAIDENGTARPNLNREGLSSEVAESLTALGMSIAQLVQPYLNLPATNTQINI